MIEFKDGRYFAALWFIPGEGERDFLAALWRDAPGGPWSLAYRFRYYVDDKAHGSADKKSWWSAKFEGDEAKAVAAVDQLADGVVLLGFGGPIHKIIVKSDRAAECSAALEREEWAHMRTAGAHETLAMRIEAGGDRVAIREAIERAYVDGHLSDNEHDDLLNKSRE